MVLVFWHYWTTWVRQEFEHSDITTARKIRTAVRSPNSSQKQMTIINCFSK
jgi:hypothetical protein